jgi:CRP-like cAMP-binding protein
MVVGLDVDLVGVPTTPLALLLAVLVTAVVLGAILVGITTLGTPLVDKRWPADEPLDPTEMLWGESGNYIQRHFKGLDLDASKDLATQFVEVKVPAGTYIVEQGDPATHFYVLKSGEAEVIQRSQAGGLQREDVIRRHVAGDSFGEIGILRRTARTASIRALTDCVVLQLAAEDFVAGAAYSAAEGNELLARVDMYLTADRRRAEQASSGRRTLEAPPSAAPSATGTATLAPATADTTTGLTDSDTGAFTPTHVVPASGLLAWSRPDPSEEPVATLAAGVELRVIGETGAWAQVAAANGWEGWVDGRALQAR